MFRSALANEMAAYLELRAASVSKGAVANDRRALVSLDQHLNESGFTKKELTEETLDTWMPTISGKSKTVSEKVGAIRGFVKYLNSLGIRSFLPDPPKVKSDYIPYIYSDQELRLIMHYADNLIAQKHRPEFSFSLKVPMIIRILYGCGTRVAETMALQRKDIDFRRGTLFLRQTKFSKERMIPVHKSLLDILEQYCLTLGIMNKPDAYLFAGKDDGHHYTTRQVNFWFSRILKLAGIDQRYKQSGERGACPHCLRHLFVLKSMQQLEASGRPVDMNDLLLPTYLGHKCLLDTDKYMRFSGVQDLAPLAAFETFTAGLIPQVEVPHEEE